MRFFDKQPKHFEARLPVPPKNKSKQAVGKNPIKTAGV